MLKQLLKLSGRTEAQGRNGYFVPREVEVTKYQNPNADFVEVAVYSRSRGNSAPIMVELLPGEVAELVAALEATQ
jgi:hypothetical protein